DLVNHIVVHLVRLRGITSLESGKDGVVVTFGTEADPGSNTGTVKDWYLEPSVNLSMSNSVGQSSSIKVGADGKFVKANKKAKFILQARSSYLKQTIEFSEGVQDEYEELSLGMSTYYIRSLKNNRWSIALI